MYSKIAEGRGEVKNWVKIFSGELGQKFFRGWKNFSHTKIGNN